MPGKRTIPKGPNRVNLRSRGTRRPHTYLNKETGKYYKPSDGLPKQGSAQSQLHTFTAYWKMDEAGGNRADERGLRDLQAAATPPPGAPGIINNGADFEAASGQELAALPPQLPAYANDWTISMWWNQESLAAPQTLLAIDGAIPPNRGLLLILNPPGDLLFGMSPDGTAQTSGTMASGLGLSTWYHLVLRFTLGSGADGFINGTPLTPISFTTPIHDPGPAFPMFVGNLLVVTSHFDGLIDEIGFWSHALSDADSLALYNGGAGTTPPF